jgi:hypothetical protein
MPGWKPPPAGGMVAATPQWTAPPAPTCLRCGYAGPPISTSHGGPDGCLGLVLLCLGILPGVLYFIFASTTQVRHCPQCGGFLGQSTGSGCLTVLVALAVLAFVLVAAGALTSVL